MPTIDPDGSNRTVFEPTISLPAPVLTIRRRPIPAHLRRLVYARDHHQCVKCGRRRPLTIDHIVPVALGGTNHIRNLQTMCASCNVGKRARMKGGRRARHVQQQVLSRRLAIAFGLDCGWLPVDLFRVPVTALRLHTTNDRCKHDWMPVSEPVDANGGRKHHYRCFVCQGQLLALTLPPYRPYNHSTTHAH